MTAAPPDLTDLEALLARGHELEDQGAHAQAKTYYEQALARFPDSPLPSLNLGNSAFSEGNLSLAERWYQKALAIGPCAAAELNLGNLSLDRGDARRAIPFYQRAVDSRPGWPPAILGMANSMIAVGHQADAVAMLDAEINRGLRDRACLHLLAELQRPKSASAALRTLALDPSPTAETYAFRAKLRTILLDNRGALQDMLQALELAPTNDDYRRFVLFTSMLLDDITPEQLMSWVKKRKAIEPGRIPTRSPTRGRRLRIGYLSCDFRRHAAAHYLYPIIKGHNRKQFEVWLLSGTTHHDHITSIFKAMDAKWADLCQLTPEEARERILALELDIIVECSGNTVDSLLPLLDMRLAPLQLSMIGLSLTTGSPTIDYRVVSELTDPVGATNDWNSENLLYAKSMECVYHSFDGGHEATELPASSRGLLTVGYFNNSTKLNLETLLQLRRVLECPTVRLIIVGVDHPETVSIVRSALSGYDSRFEILRRLPFQDYLATIRSADIAWDSFPYSGSTTTLDCMLQGVPVLTLASDKSHSKSTSARMRAIGFGEFIKANDDQRVSAILAYAENSATLREIRHTLPRATRSHLDAGQSVFSQDWDEQLVRLSESHESGSNQASNSRGTPRTGGHAL